ncbi:MAG TPA: IS21 family transposase [Gammaproteobacteria bacterium]|nr:IS21 family transposase [Gammaproteobacteria bacterium]
MLRHYLERGLSKAALARELGVSRRTLYHWIETGQLDRELDDAPVRSGPRPSVVRKLDPYRALIRTRLAQFPELTAVRLLEEIRAAGYSGGYTQLKAYVRELRPVEAAEPVVRFETPPGHQAQVDFAEFRLPWGKRYAPLVVLGYSRLLWLQYYPHQSLDVLIEALEAAFGYFGGVPAELLFDQMKAVIIADRRPDDGSLLENARFGRFAAHWGFRIRACRPYRARTKGKVERPIRYARQSFFYGRDFVSDADLNAQALAWMEQVANVRLHRATGERPRQRFERDERALLQPLARRSFRALLPTPAPVPEAPSAGSPLPTVERGPLSVYAHLVQAHGGAA